MDQRRAKAGPRAAAFGFGFGRVAVRMLPTSEGRDFYAVKGVTLGVDMHDVRPDHTLQSLVGKLFPMYGPEEDAQQEAAFYAERGSKRKRNPPPKPRPKPPPPPPSAAGPADAAKAVLQTVLRLLALLTLRTLLTLLAVLTLRTLLTLPTLLPLLTKYKNGYPKLDLQHH